MSHVSHNIIQPPTQGELENCLAKVRSLSSMVIELTVERILDEVSARRDPQPILETILFKIDNITTGVTPTIVGHINEEERKVGTIGVVVNDKIPDKDRRLILDLYVPNDIF